MTEAAPTHAIIAGFGVPGRAVAEWLEGQGLSYTVIETNPSTVQNAGKCGRRMVAGDATNPNVLHEAGIETASLLIVAIPNEKSALVVTREARRMNPTVRIITRTHFSSAGIEAKQLGANEVIVAEQTVAFAFCELLQGQPAHLPCNR